MDCPELENIPDSIGGLESLCDLRLQSTGITQLPESIGKLVNLITLVVLNNKLRGLPATICDLVNLPEVKVINNKDLGAGIPVEFDRVTIPENIELFKDWDQLASRGDCQSVLSQDIVGRLRSDSGVGRSPGKPDEIKNFNLVPKSCSKLFEPNQFGHSLVVK